MLTLNARWKSIVLVFFPKMFLLSSKQIQERITFNYVIVLIVKKILVKAIKCVNK